METNRKLSGAWLKKLIEDVIAIKKELPYWMNSEAIANLQKIRKRTIRNRGL